MASTFGKPAKKKHPFRKFLLIGAFATVALWGDYQYYTPDSWKDKVGQKVEEVTGSTWLGEAFGKAAAKEGATLETPVGTLQYTPPPQQGPANN